MSKPKECTTEGVTATFHLANGQTRQINFRTDKKVTLGSHHNGGWFIGRYVHDGTYSNPNNNHDELERYCKNCVSQGMWTFGNEMIPFLEVIKITKATFIYEVEIDPTISQGD